MLTHTLLLQGNRVCVRDWRTDDLSEFERWNQPGHRWHETDGPYYPRDTPEELQQRIERIRNRMERLTPGAPRVTAVLSETSRSPMIGMVSRYWECEPCGSIYVGVSIFDDTKWGQGLGTEALRLWTTYLFDAMDLVRLGLQTWSGNLGMVKSAAKAGYREEGRLRMARVVNGEYYDSIIMGVLKSEWMR